MQDDQPDLIALTTQIVAAYVGAAQVPPGYLPGLIGDVHRALNALEESDEPVLGPSLGKLTAAQIRKSIRPDGLISFENGRSYKSLKPHLSARGLTVADYKAKWGLPDNYPATAPSYSAQRSALAKRVGLGKLGGRRKKPADPAVR